MLWQDFKAFVPQHGIIWESKTLCLQSQCTAHLTVQCETVTTRPPDRGSSQQRQRRRAGRRQGGQGQGAWGRLHLCCPQNPGPMVEIHFWEAKCMNLESLFDQMKDDITRKMASILNVTDSAYYPCFRYTPDVLLFSCALLKVSTDIK